jgi:regulatory protein
MSKITIVAIETTGRSPRARRLRFDRAEPLLTSSSVVKLLALAEGDQWDEQRLGEALAEAEPELAKERAFRMLEYRERSREELLRSLLDDGYSRATADAVVARLEELGLVDDMRFSTMWTRSRVHAGYDRRRIHRELGQKGIDPAVIIQALDEAAPAEAGLERARKALRGKRATDRASRDKLVRRLVSRGFDLQTAIAAVTSEDEDDTLT